jgi:hypothetical protein
MHVFVNFQIPEAYEKPKAGFLGTVFEGRHPIISVVETPSFTYEPSRDSSVGIALGYGLDDRGSMVRFPAVAGDFSLHHRVQNGSEAHPASYPTGTRSSFPGGKAAGAWSWPLTSI